MIIAVNTRLLLKNRLEGIGWFTYETLKRITTSHPEHTFIFIFDRNYDDEFIFSDNIIPVVASPPTRHPVLWYYWFEKVIPAILKKYKADLFLSPDGYNSLYSEVDSLIVMHDINFVHRPGDLPFLIRKYFNYYFPKFAKKATRIATVSEYSKNDIAKNFNIPGEKIDVVYNGANNLFKPLSENDKAEVRNEFSEGHEYFLFVGALHPRKNVAGLIKAYDEFRKSKDSNVKLVIVGNRMFKSGDIEYAVSLSPYQSDIIFTGRLESDKLVRIVGAALALTFVPFFEGFGIPVIEAFYCDTPVITSNVTSLPEIAGNAAVLVDPNSIDSMKNAMLDIYTDDKMRLNLIKNCRIVREKFSWDKTADNLWESIKKAKENM